MYVIIGPKRLEELQHIKFPLNENGMLDCDSFYNTTDGQAFAKIAPFRISHCNAKNKVIESMHSDIAFIGLCYKCPLYVYIVSDSWFYKNVRLPIHSNLGNVSRLKSYGCGMPDATVTMQNKSLRVNKEESYFNGDYNAILEAVTNIVKAVNLTAKTVWAFKLTPECGFVECTTKAPCAGYETCQ